MMPGDIDVSPADLIERVIAAVTDGSPDTLAALRAMPGGERAVAATETARREVAGLRRREHELSALFSSARELAGVRDTDALLVRLVERAHEMLGSDVTYLSEYDPATRRLHVRATHGAVSAAFRDLVVPAGRGLVSVVVETGAPQAVSRYADYAAERHEPVVDDAVAAEGIVSMLGVPLRTETTVLGVLFVAMRQERAFGPDQIALLSALADHASIVLQTAGTLRSLQHSEEEARATLAQLSAHLVERDRANTVHQQLVHAVLTGGGFSHIAETLARTLDRAVRIVDERGDERATAGDVAALRSDAGADLEVAASASRTSGHAAAFAARDGQRVVAALAAGPRVFGAVHIEAGTYDLGAVDLRTVERAAQVGALLALAEEAVVEAQQRQQGDLVADIVAASPERRVDIAARVRRVGFDLDALDRLIVVAVAGDDRPTALRALARAVGPHGLVGESDGVLVVLGDSARTPFDAAAAHAAISAVGGAATVAVDAPATGGPAGERHDLAVRALRLALALGVADAHLDADELLPYAAVVDADQRALARFLDTTIGAVRAYDADRGTELLATLRAFVRHGASPTRTARALTFHPNTILQRLDRLDAVLGAGWRDDERLFRISLAVRLDDLRSRLTA